ncbi:MFS transporter [Streptomyces cacaoi]|uniref:MFS transporter n=1 Tax=Streptomyces cacaoi TaxID=1898 RepID=UPI0033301D17
MTTASDGEGGRKNGGRNDRASRQQTAEAERAADPRRWRVLAALCGALLVLVLDNTVLNVALPSLAADFSAPPALQQAVLDAYVVLFAGLLLPAGAVADRWGRRRALLTGTAVLAVASAAAAAAWSVWWLVAMRAVMGAGAALVMPATLAVIVQVFPAHERPRAFAVWAAVASGGMAVGPVLGGALVTAWSWAGVFLVNVPVLAVAAFAVVRLVPESRDPRARPVDGPGAALVTLGMTALTWTVIRAGEGGAGARTAAGAALAVAALTAFARRQRRLADPLVDFTLYRDARFAGGSAAASLLTLGTGSALYLLAGCLQRVRGLSALEAGAAIVPLAAGIVLGSAAGGRGHARLGARRSVVAGFLTTAAGFATLAALTPTSPYALLATGLALAGLGTGFAGPSTTSTVLGALPPRRAGMGSALNDTHQQLGTALGIAGLGALQSALERGAPAAADAAHRTTGALTVTFLTAAACAAAGALTAALTLRRT